MHFLVRGEVCVRDDVVGCPVGGGEKGDRGDLWEFGSSSPLRNTTLNVCVHACVLLLKKKKEKLRVKR
jgi:hypothetical protein